MDQNNPYVANFLIQHAIWCIEEFGVDGWRIDTYIYIDMNFMNRCNKALLDEYPQITMFGESWVRGTANQAYFARNIFNTPFKSNLPGAIDFNALFEGILPAVKQPGEGLNKLYQTLSNDFLYKDPMTNVIFLDNHDMTRFFSEVGEDVAKHKMGLAWLLTGRGIPQMYYGTEVLMKGISNPDGWVRLDFPGGWENDKKNAFTKQGLTKDERDVLQFTTTLANFRKNASALKTGKLMHYVPENGVYVYFRYNDKQTVMCIMNPGDNEVDLGIDRFSERMKGFSKGRNVITGDIENIITTIKILPKTISVLEMMK
jgi:glycosidase